MTSGSWLARTDRYHFILILQSGQSGDSRCSIERFRSSAMRLAREDFCNPVIHACGRRYVKNLCKHLMPALFSLQRRCTLGQVCSRTRPVHRRGMEFRLSLVGALVMVAFGVAACATPRLDAVPIQETSSVRILGIENARYYTEFRRYCRDEQGSCGGTRSGAPLSRRQVDAAGELSGLVRRRRRWCVRRRPPGRLERTRHAARLQAGHRHQHRRAVRSVRLPWAGLRPAASSDLHRDDGRRRLCGAAAGERGARQ